MRGTQVTGANSFRIGHFQARARQLTSQAYGRAIDRGTETAALLAVFFMY